ncbi:MAG: 4a-hydroxytetrahydrobiopterin dehydratase [Betaproteobacteria bacterium]|nr:4a-hydroxytetrahydrobiopterin dehydratase [Betaproteobacteria bacterium]
MPERSASAPRERVYDAQAVDARLRAELPRWSRDGGGIQRRYRTAGWKASVLAVGAVAHLAEAAWHHPELSVGYDHLVVRLSTHSAGGVTDKDFELAARIEQLLTWRPRGQPGSALEGTPEDPRFAYLPAEQPPGSAD